MGASVVSGSDASPVLEPAEHVLDLVASAVEDGVMRDRHVAVGSGRDAGGDAAIGQGLAEPVGIVAFVAKQGRGIREGINHQRSAFIVTHLPFAEQHDQRSATTITHSVQLGVQAALGSPDTSGNSPFLSRLAAVRCAFKWVASIIS